MPHISTGWHYGMLLSSDAKARQNIILLFVIATKCFVLWLKMKDGIDGNRFLTCAMTAKSPRNPGATRLGGWAT